jgi:hypothetical protein
MNDHQLASLTVGTPHWPTDTALLLLLTTSRKKKTREFTQR